MARSGGRGRGGRADAGATPPEADRIIDAALTRIATDGWRHLSLAAIAADTGLPVLRVYRSFASKQAVLDGFLARIDEAVLTAPPAGEAEERPRDRVFDLLMRRFDAFRPHRAVLAGLRRDLPGDPLTALCLAVRFARSLRWILDTAEVATDGLSGALAVRLTGAAYLSTMRVWQHDDTPDLGQTMAALDARLRRIERWLVPRRSADRAGPGTG